MVSFAGSLTAQERIDGFFIEPKGMQDGESRGGL
jgi:hypothetical protein